MMPHYLASATSGHFGRDWSVFPAQTTWNSKRSPAGVLATHNMNALFSPLVAILTSLAPCWSYVLFWLVGSKSPVWLKLIINLEGMSYSLTRCTIQWNAHSQRIAKSSGKWAVAWVPNWTDHFITLSKNCPTKVSNTLNFFKRSSWCFSMITIMTDQLKSSWLQCLTGECLVVTFLSPPPVSDEKSKIPHNLCHEVMNDDAQLLHWRQKPN